MPRLNRWDDNDDDFDINDENFDNYPQQRRPAGGPGLVSGRQPSPQPSDEEFLAGRQAVDGGHSVQTSQLHGGREGPRQAEDGHYLGGRRPRLKEGQDRGRDCQVQQSGGYWL